MWFVRIQIKLKIKRWKKWTNYFTDISKNNIDYGLNESQKLTIHQKQLLKIKIENSGRANIRSEKYIKYSLLLWKKSNEQAYIVKYILTNALQNFRGNK